MNKNKILVEALSVLFLFGGVAIADDNKSITSNGVSDHSKYSKALKELNASIDLGKTEGGKAMKVLPQRDNGVSRSEVASKIEVPIELYSKGVTREKSSEAKSVTDGEKISSLLSLPTSEEKLVEQRLEDNNLALKGFTFYDLQKEALRKLSIIEFSMERTKKCIIAARDINSLKLCRP